MFCTYTERNVNGEKVREWTRSGVIAYRHEEPYMNSPEQEWMKENFETCTWDTRILDPKRPTGEKSRKHLGKMINPDNSLNPGKGIKKIRFWKTAKSADTDIILTIKGDLTMQDLSALHWFCDNSHVLRFDR